MIEVKSGVYQIINLINNEYYIGSTANFISRKWQHFSISSKRAKYQNSHLRRAMDKYGRENFIFEILEIVEDKQLRIEREQYYLDTLKPYYNICPKAFSCAGRILTDLHKKRISEAQSGEKHWFYGKHLSEETKRKLSESHKYTNNGEKNGMFGRCKELNPMYGKLGKQHHNSKQVICIETYIVYGSIAEAERCTNISYQHIGAVCSGKRKTAGGFHWKYCNEDRSDSN